MTDKDTGDGKWKAEQGEGDLESMGGDGWSRQTSQTKQRLSNRKPEMNQPCSWEQGMGVRTPGTGSLLAAGGMPRSQGGNVSSLLEGRTVSVAGGRRG